MSITAKERVKSFYEKDLLKDQSAFVEYLHPDVTLDWNSSFGFNQRNYNELVEMFADMGNSFMSLRCEISHLLEEKDVVTVRYTYFARPIEEPEQEDAIAHFVTIWELKDKKLYKGYQISQQADNTLETLSSFLLK